MTPKQLNQLAQETAETKWPGCDETVFWSSLSHRKTIILRALETAINPLTKRIEELRKDTPTADAVIWREKANELEAEITTLRAREERLATFMEQIVKSCPACGGSRLTLSAHGASPCQVCGLAAGALEERKQALDGDNL